MRSEVKELMIWGATTRRLIDDRRPGFDGVTRLDVEIQLTLKDV